MIRAILESITEGQETLADFDKKMAKAGWSRAKEVTPDKSPPIISGWEHPTVPVRVVATVSRIDPDGPITSMVVKYGEEIPDDALVDVRSGDPSYELLHYDKATTKNLMRLVRQMIADEER